MAEIRHLNWMQLEDYLRRDDRVILPIGSTEQHAYLSFCVDAILAERVSVDAAQPLGVPVYPALPYGVAPYFTGYPGTISIQVETYVRLITDLLDNLKRSGFRRILIVSGHGGNAPAGAAAFDWSARTGDVEVQFHEWWKAPRTAAAVNEIDDVASHASWMENFPWTRLAGVALPSDRKPMIDSDRMRQMSPENAREYLGDGNFGGLYQRPDDEMEKIWGIAVDEVRERLSSGWTTPGPSNEAPA